MLPKQLGRYEIQAEIGLGPMRRVYRASDPLCRRLVAIKTIKSEYLSERASKDYLRRFQREARAAGALSHPNIVSVYDISKDYFVMEYLEGTTLLNLLADRKCFTPMEVLSIVAPIADALDYAHEQGVIHRDIKPSNIMLLPGGQPKIMDFGVAHLESTLMTTAGQSLGSPPYMSPEAILGGDLTASADTFSLAVVTYEMLTGRRPFDGGSITSILYRVVNQDPPPLGRWNPALPSRYDRLFREALAKKPAERFGSGAEFVQALGLSTQAQLRLVSGAMPRDTNPGVPAVPKETGALEPHRAPSERKVVAHESPRSVTDRRKAFPVSLTVRLRRTTFLATSGLLAAAGMALVSITVSSDTLAPAATSPSPALQVETSPPGATVWLSGYEVGASPLTVTPLPVGKLALRVAKDGFVPVEKTFEAQVGVEPPPFLIELRPARTGLFLKSEPAGALVRVDGEPVGSAPIEDLAIEPGAHEILVERKGYRPWSFQVEVEPGESVHLIAPLYSVAPAQPLSDSPRRTRQGDLVELGPGMVPPEKISGEFATYPPQAMERWEQGRVTVEMTISRTGQPMDLRVVESAGPLLDRALLEAVWRWRFQPAEKDGVKVRVPWRVSQSFKIGPAADLAKYDNRIRISGLPH
jgi:serine/threonine-protein kinase